MNNTTTPTNWAEQASLFEILALGFKYPSGTAEDSLSTALASGEYAEALQEILLIVAPGSTVSTEIIAKLEQYKANDAAAILSELRREHTRLFIGTPDILIPPYGGNWLDPNKAKALLFVNKEAMAVEQFMGQCGVGQPPDSNEPLDHIASELEFLQYLCLLQTGAVAAPSEVNISPTAYSDFYSQHFTNWIPEFAQAIKAKSQNAFFTSLADVLLGIVL